jgi:DNA-binding transcriptional MerR regulator
MLSIGEFSLVTRLSVKTLRFYHDEGILLPDHIDDESGYRYYRQSSIDKARVIALLRRLEFSVADIREMLSDCSEDADLIFHLERQRDLTREKIKNASMVESSLNEIINSIRRSNMESNRFFEEVREINIDDMIFAGYRFKGRYEEVGKAFKIAGRRAGRHICGCAMTLYFDDEYKENDADIEGGFPVKKQIRKNEIDCRVLKGGRAVSVMHRGPYETIGKSYERIFGYINEKGYKTIVPSREIYLKGPGMVFRGNPRSYITEIQMFVG